MDKQEHEKPGEDLVSLPPILPGLEIRIGDDDSDVNRIYNLSGRAYSTAVYARKNRSSPRQKGNLMVSFRRECQKVLGLVSNMAKSFAGTSHQDHFNFFKDYKCWCKSLEEFVEKSLVDNTAVLGHFLNLFYSQMNLLEEAMLLESITTDTTNKTLREGVQKWTKEHQEQIQASQDTKPVKEQPKAEEKNKGGVKKLLKIVGTIIVGLFVAFLADIFGNLGWTERITDFIYRIFWSK